MGFGDGFAGITEQTFEVRGAESSLSGNADTDIIVFNLQTPFNVGVDEDVSILDPATPTAVSVNEDSTGHTVATSVVVDTP